MKIKKKSKNPQNYFFDKIIHDRKILRISSFPRAVQSALFMNPGGVA